MSARGRISESSKTGWAIVTGASSGIGRAFALRLAGSGHPVLLVARRGPELERVAAEIAGRGGRAEILTVDLVAPGGVESVVARAGELGEIDVLVNSAGFGNYGPFLSQSGDRQRDEVALNIGAVVALSRGVLPRMLARGRGQIVNLASLLSFMPTPYFATYGATKAFVLSFSEALAQELRGTGVRVFASCPGPAKSGFVHVAGAELAYDRFPQLDPDVVARRSLSAVRRGKVLRVIGWLNALITFSVRITPRFLMRRIMDLVLGPPGNARFRARFASHGGRG
jgi:short-subunit dehydrogenase